MNLRGYLPKAFGLPRPTRPHSQKADACVFGGISQSLLPGGDTLAKMEFHGGNLGLTLNTTGLHTLQKVAPAAYLVCSSDSPRREGCSGARFLYCRRKGAQHCSLLVNCMPPLPKGEIKQKKLKPRDVGPWGVKQRKTNFACKTKEDKGGESLPRISW